MDWNHALSIAGVVTPLLGLPTFYAVIRFGKHQVVATFRHAVAEVVDEKVAPILQRLDATDDWRAKVEHEITPNSGSSMKDKLDALYEVVVDLKAATTVQRNMESAKADAFADGQYDSRAARAGQFT